uniref:Endonuclease n=1 Tax=Anopheles gambiae TaxID=7165 RepID=A0A453YZM1_ANOGA
MGPKKARGCKACGNQVDDTLYVQCDECDAWWHFSCAGITASVEAVEKCAWLCEECARKTLREQSSPREGNKEPKEGTSKHVDGDLVRNLSLEAATDGGARPVTNPQRRPLLSLDEANDEIAPGTSTHVAGGPVHNLNQDAATEGGVRPVMTPKRRPLSSLDEADRGKTSVSSNIVHRGSCPNLNLDAASDDVARQLAVLKRRQEVEKRRMELELQLKFVQEEEALLGFGENKSFSISPQLNSFQTEKRTVKRSEEEKEEPDLTPRQEAARHMVSKELPVFSGDPAEWPIFISHYEYTTRRCGYSNWENMLRLQKCLKGPALEAVRSRLVLPDVVPQVIEKLRSKYGRPVHLIKTFIEKVRKIPAPQTDKLDSLVEYGEAVQCMVDHMVAAGERAHITNPLLLQEVVGKLPTDQQLRWSHHIRGMTSVDLSTFSDYMEDLAEDAARLTTIDSPSVRGTSKGRPTKGYVHAHVDPDGATTSSAAERQCVSCNVAGHVLSTCTNFRGLPVKDRWRRARELSVCFSCLEKHNWRSCKNRSRCGINDCAFRHHALLHDPDAIESPSTADRERRHFPRTSGSQTHQVINNYHQSNPMSALFRIVPVTAYGPGVMIKTFAFLDEGSSMTLMDEDLAKQLGVKGDRRPLCIKWTGDTTRVEPASMMIDLQIGPVTSTKRFTLKAVRTVTSLSLPQQTFTMDDKRWDHLKQLPLPEYRDARPQLLIGLDNLRLAVPLKTREGLAGEPVAVKTRLGWCVYGKTAGSQIGRVLHMCECGASDENSTIQGALRKFYELEQLGTVSSDVPDPDERRALTILETTTVRIGNRFESGLLWKTDNVELPSSLGMARRRLECLERRMERDPKLKTVVHHHIADMMEKGYIHKATSAELAECNSKRIWYLPLGVVTNPKKPGKVRIIWDAAAKVQGTSLNDMLLKGPDELISLPGVLFRFRMYGIAVCADVKEMFLQIRMRDEDKHAQRFLWREDPADDIATYFVDVVTFGSACSPATAQYVKNRNAKEHAEKYPRAVRGILTSTYVDDYLDSFGTFEEASRVSREVRGIFSNGGFVLRNWVSNNPVVLERLGGESSSPGMKSLTSTADDGERVLGLRWNPSSDQLSFYTQACVGMAEIFETECTPTKREVLKCVMSLFDPLGLLANFTIHGRILIQDLWRAGTGWDEAISPSQMRDWRRWVDVFPLIAQLRIPRCYFPEAREKVYENAELHLFVDASQLAYACVLYLRVVDSEGEPHCTMLCGKAKVAPLKPLTIPKMELQACLLGARLLKSTEQHHPISVKKRVLWTDSTVALSWIHADPRNYRPFVANRVAEIQENTNVNEWRWVPTQDNPADEATKWKGRANFNWDGIWFQGPSFLLQDEESWPTRRLVSTTPEEEIRRVNLHREKLNPGLLPLKAERFSRLERMIRTLAWIVRYVDNLMRKVGGAPLHLGILSQDELERAETIAWKQAQGEYFQDEVRVLSVGEGTGRSTVPKESPIYGLLPYADERGVLRMRGRIGAAPELPYAARYPIVLPRDAWITHLLVDKFHRRFRHANNETVVNELRQYFQIPKMRRLVSKVVRQCVFCHIRRTLPQIPPMAPLPKQRLTAFVRPFTFVGLDYFGPLLVRRGRAQEKRWVALFTCLTIRAIHLEVVSSLSTDSCILAVRRFVARRGAPVEVFSDNGTNFVGASQQLRKEIDERNDALAATFTNANTRWTFNPPGAPHMGGVWERMVRSVKAAMSTMTELQRTPDDETLLTVIVEAEGMINTRPLTYIPLESADQESLTPNHFLLGSSSGVKQRPVAPTSLQTGLRSNWKMVQHILDGFWRRWIKEYLPVLARQSKWFETVREIEVGDIVLIVDGGARNQWKRGIVERVVSGADGRIRQAWVRTNTGTLRRPAAKLALLEIRKGDK